MDQKRLWLLWRRKFRPPPSDYAPIQHTYLTLLYILKGCTRLSDFEKRYGKLFVLAKTKESVPSARKNTKYVTSVPNFKTRLIS